MRKAILGLLACAVLAAIPVTMSTMASAQAPAATPPPPAAPPPPPPAPQMPPSLVPSLSVDLMTAQGSAALGAQWKTMEAKIVEGPAIAGHMPGYDKSYDISHHA